jgi:hypothetical protein
MGLPAKKPNIQHISKREKVWRYMELRGIVDWFEAKLDMYYKPVASVPDAPNFIELMGIEVTKEELLQSLIEICSAYWDRESELDEALEILETRVGQKLIDRPGDLSQKLNNTFEQYIKTKLDEKMDAFKRSQLH